MISKTIGNSEKQKGNFLIAFATELEAAKTLELFDAKYSDEGLYTFSHGLIAITGMGSLQAVASLSKIPFDEILNIGFAASLKGEKVGTLVPVGQVKKLPFLPVGSHSLNLFHKLHPTLDLGAGQKLMTSDFPLHHKSLKKSLEADLVDMEGYGIAFLCQKMQKKVTMWKIVSDFGEEGGQALIQKASSRLSEQIAEFLWTTLKEKTHLITSATNG